MRPALLLLCSLFFAVPAFAQNLRVVTVPVDPLDPSVPHAAYNGHATTFKAIARGGSGTYFTEWDFDGNGVYDANSTTSNPYNLSLRFQLPNQASDTTFLARVRVTSAGQTVTGTYPVHVFADVPADPGNANARQLQIQRSVAIDDALWFLHTSMTRAGDPTNPLTGAQITGHLAEQTTYTAGGFLEVLGRTKHYPAFPDAYLGELPDAAENTRRWRDDPYAEDAARLVNFLLSQASAVSVSAQDESNLSGFYPEATLAPIPGTDDGIGLLIGASPGDQSTGHAASALRGLAFARLQGFVAQVGDPNRVLGRRFEHLVQQLVDGLVFSQNDSGSYPGSWGFTPNQTFDVLGEYITGAIEAVPALFAAERRMGASGVIVPNLAKARLVNYLLLNQEPCPGGGTGGTAFSSSSGVCDLGYSAAHVFGLGWLGANTFATADARLAFPSYFGLTRGQLRTSWNSDLVYVGNSFAGSSSSSIPWETGFVEGGNFNRVDGMGNHYTMLQWARAARAAEPPIFSFGTNDWARLFSLYLLRNQAANGGWNWAFSSGASSLNDQNVGPLTRAAFALLVLSPDEPVPVVVAQASARQVPEGTAVDFTARPSTPGDVSWSFGNGATATGTSVQYRYPDNGLYNAYALVTTVGGQGEAYVSMTITNVAPVVDAGVDLTIDEGSAVSLSGSFFDPGTDDTHSVQWTFGDSTMGNTLQALKTYAEQGTFVATLRVTDDDGASSTDTTTITVRNVAPTITSSPTLSARLGEASPYTLTFTDPGTTDTHTCEAQTAPPGAQLTGCALSWTPTQVGPQGFRLCVVDDDGGRTCQDFTVTVTVVDTDGDGLADAWETLHFGNLAQTASADPDLDGVDNGAELTLGTNPTLFDGPSSPTLPMPMCAGRVASARPVLSVTNATDPQAAALTYEFEVYEDAALTSLVVSAAGVPSGVGFTQWRVSTALDEDATYHWRARAADAFAVGAWTSTCSFTVNAVDGAPGLPRLDMPSHRALVTSLTPTLSVENAVDPEGDALTYEFEVLREGARVAHGTMVAPGAPLTSWQVTPALSEGVEYTWRARAVSAGGPGPFTAPWSFRVETSEAAPGTPVIVSPQNGTVVDTLSPLLVFLPVTDADGDTVVYDWELVAGDSFASPLHAGSDVSATQVSPNAELSEDTRYCWRVRADDGKAQSPWARACFTTSATDGAPGVPSLLTPIAGRTVETLSPLFAWSGVTDPERQAVTYELELSRDGSVVTTLLGLQGTTAIVAEPLTDGAGYSWRVRARDDGGAAGAWSEAATFQVQLPAAPAPMPATGCGCVATPGWGFLPLGLALLLRRRRSQSA